MRMHPFQPCFKQLYRQSCYALPAKQSTNNLTRLLNKYGFLPYDPLNKVDTRSEALKVTSDCTGSHNIRTRLAKVQRSKAETYEPGINLRHTEKLKLLIISIVNES